MKMELIVKRVQTGSTFGLTGCIAILATGPRKKSIETFDHELPRLMRNDPDLPKGTMPTARPVHTEKQQFTMSDRNVIILVLMGVGAIMLASLVFRIPEMVLATLVIPAVYYLVKNL